jgi:hypothetical protein
VVRTRNLLVASLVICVVLVALVWFTFTAPALSGQSTAQQALTSQSLLYQAAQERLTNVSPAALQAQANTAWDTSMRVDALLPFLAPSSNPANPPVVSTQAINKIQLITLPAIIAATGLHMSSVIPAPAADTANPTDNGLTYRDYTASVTGSLGQITALLRSLSSAPQLFSVPQLSLSNAASDPVQASLIIRAWFAGGAPELLPVK